MIQNFDINMINELLSKYDGNFSLLFPLIYDKFKKTLLKNPNAYINDGEENLFFEFSCFEDDYYVIKKDIIENNLLDKEVVDIGSQLGIQSEIFLDMEKYISIDNHNSVILNMDLSQVEHHNKLFPIDDLNISDKIVISNMSLGFFNLYHGEKDSNSNIISDTDLILINELAKSNILYCNSRPIFIEELKKKFKNNLFLSSYKYRKANILPRVSTGVWKLWN